MFIVDMESTIKHYQQRIQTWTDADVYICASGQYRVISESPNIVIAWGESKEDLIDKLDTRIGSLQALVNGADSQEAGYLDYIDVLQQHIALTRNMMERVEFAVRGKESSGA